MRAAARGLPMRSETNGGQPPLRHTYVDAIRGLAALGVIYFHVADEMQKRHFVHPLESLVFNFFTNTFDLGILSVTLFFAVSGFVVPFSLLRNKVSPIRDFAISRLFRLYPAY